MEYLSQDLVAGYCPHPTVELEVHHRGRSKIAFSRAGSNAVGEFGQGFGIAILKPGPCLNGGRTFELHPQLEPFPKLFFAELSYLRAFIGKTSHESEPFELQQGLPHRSLTDPEVLRQLHFQERVAGAKVSGVNRHADGIGHARLDWTLLQRLKERRH